MNIVDTERIPIDPKTRKEKVQHYLHMMRYEKAIKELKKFNVKKVLDVGCGHGHGTNILSKHFDVIGIDKNRKAISEAKSLYPHIRFVCLAAEKILNIEERFDAIICMESIEHFSNPKKFLLNSKRILKKDSYLFFSTPNREIFGNTNPFHNEFTFNEVRDLIEACNYKILKYWSRHNKFDFLRHNIIPSLIKDSIKDFYFTEDSKGYEFLILCKKN